MEENDHHKGWRWPGAGPGVNTPRPAASRYGGPELLVRIALCALSGLLVSLIWILGGSADAQAKAWSVVIGLSAIAAMSLFAGLSRSEADKVRAEVADSEVRT